VWKLADWLDEYKAEHWNYLIQADAKPGKLDKLVNEALADHRADHTLFL
jgi:hypothetical protein